jgi:hypothetical protein
MSYTDIFNNSPDGLSMGMPTVDPGAAVTNLGQTTNTGLTAPTVTTPGMTAPQVPGTTGGGGAAPQAPGFFSQYGPAQFALGAIQTLGSLWNSFQQNKMAKESMKFQKEAFATNLANQEQSYNTALEDRVNARYVTEGKSQAETQSYIEKNRL